MTESEQSISHRLREWNKHGDLYLWPGAAAIILAFTFFPPLGLLGIVCGVLLYRQHDQLLPGILLAVFGGFALAVFGYQVF